MGTYGKTNRARNSSSQIQPRLVLGDEENPRQRMKKKCKLNPGLVSQIIPPFYPLFPFFFSLTYPSSQGWPRHIEPSPSTRKPVWEQGFHQEFSVEMQCPCFLFTTQTKPDAPSKFNMLSSCMTGGLLPKNSNYNKIGGILEDIR